MVGRWGAKVERSREVERLRFWGDSVVKGNWAVEGGAVVEGAWVEGTPAVEGGVVVMSVAAAKCGALALIPRR